MLSFKWHNKPVNGNFTGLSSRGKAAVNYTVTPMIDHLYWLYDEKEFRKCKDSFKQRAGEKANLDNIDTEN